MSRLGWDREGLCGFYRPGGAVFDALGVIGELVVEKLQEAVSFFWCREDGDFGVDDLNTVVPLFSDEPSFAWRRRYKAENGRAIGGGVGGERQRCPVGEDHLGEADDGYMVWSEVAVDTGVDSLGVVRAQLYDSAGQDCFLGEDECVVGVDGVDELRVNRLADAHG